MEVYCVEQTCQRFADDESNLIETVKLFYEPTKRVNELYCTILHYDNDNLKTLRLSDNKSVEICLKNIKKIPTIWIFISQRQRL